MNKQSNDGWVTIGRKKAPDLELRSSQAYKEGTGAVEFLDTPCSWPHDCDNDSLRRRMLRHWSWARVRFCAQDYRHWLLARFKCWWDVPSFRVQQRRLLAHFWSQILVGEQGEGCAWYCVCGYPIPFLVSHQAQCECDHSVYNKTLEYVKTFAKFNTTDSASAVREYVRDS